MCDLVRANKQPISNTYFNHIFDGLSFYFDTFPLKILTQYVALKVTNRQLDYWNFSAEFFDGHFRYLFYVVMFTWTNIWIQTFSKKNLFPKNSKNKNSIKTKKF